MADFEAGVAYVGLVPSAKGFSSKAKKELAGIDLDKSVDLDADASKLREAIGQAKAQLAALDREKANPSIDFDASVAEARIAEVKDRLEQLSAQEATPKVAVQVATAQRELNGLERQLDQINQLRANVDVDADITAAQNSLRELEAKLDEVNQRRAQPQVTADTTQARARLAELDSLLSGLDARRASPEVELQVARAQQEALRIRAELDRLATMRPSPQVDADIASASAKLAAVNQQLRGLGDKTVHVNASGDAALKLGGILAVLGSIMSVAPAAVAALAAVGGAAGAIGQGVAAGLAGFNGVGDALKALEQDEKSAATSSAASSSSRAAGLKQVESAQRALGQAQTQAARAAITGGQQVADAERALQQAGVQAARARIQADQLVTAARRAVSDAVISANARVQSAERSLESAQRSRQYAQEALTDAVKDATRAQRDLNLQVSGAALSEERAALSLAQARQRLAESTTKDPLEKADLALSVREAEQNLKEVQNRYGDLKQDQGEWTRSGVAGSRQVVAATRGVQDAQRGVEDTARAVTDAQVSGARQVQDAQQALTQSQQQAAWQVQDSQRAVGDAQVAVGRAAQQAGWAQQDAARSVADAQRQLADAYTAGGDAATAGGKQAAYALAQLTPAGRSLVGFLHNEFQPAWKRVTGSVAEEMLPKVERGLRNLLMLEPLVTAGLSDTGGVLGDLAVRGSQLAVSAPFRADFASIMASNNRALSSYGDAGIHLFGAFTDVYAAAGPVVEEFARLADNSAQAFESWIIGARASGDLDRWLQQAADTLKYVGGWLVDVGTDAVHFAQGLAPLGGAVLEVTRAAADFVGWMSQVSPTLTSSVVGMTLATLAAARFATAIKTVWAGLGTFATGAKSVASVVGTVLNPTALAGTTAMTNLGVGATALAGRLGASERGATRFGAAVRGAGSYLPLFGLAVAGVAVATSELTVSTKDAAAALEKGGAAAAQARAQIAAQNSVVAENAGWVDRLDQSVNEWIGSTTGLWATTKTANDELERSRAAMTDLQRAQSYATEAQGNYEQALRDFGPTSDQARAAQQALSGATGAVAREQDNARRATMTATQALQDQQNKILASIDSRLALRQSTQQVKQAQDDLAAAVKNSGAGSDAAQQAQIRLEQAQTSQAAAARKAAEDEAKRKGVVDSSALSNEAYARSVGQMVASTQGPMTQALTEMVQGLDGAGLAAAGAKVHIDDAGNAIAVFPSGKTVTLTAQTSPEFFGALQVAKAAVDSTRGTIGVDADPGPGIAKVGAFKLGVDATRGVVTVDGNITPADQKRLGIQAKTDGTTGTMWIDGNPVPCDGRLNGMHATVDRTTGVMTIDANPGPADAANRGAHDRAAAPATMPLGMDTQPARSTFDRFISGIFDVLQGFPFLTVPVIAARRALGYAGGGLVGGYAAGGAIPGLTHRQVIRGYAAGGQSPPARSDTVPAMLTPGEFVIRKHAVDAVGLPTLHAINGMARGGVVGYARGGQTSGQGQQGTGALSVPTGDAAAASAAASATAALVESMTQATTAAGMLAPELATVTAQQQAMTSTGVAPLAGAVLGMLAPAMTAYSAAVGTSAPAANTALQAAQLATQATTAQTAYATAAHAAGMTASTAAMSLAAQGQYAALRGGQFATQVSAAQTASVTGLNNSAMTTSTAVMSALNQGHLGSLRGAQAVTGASTAAFADAWQTQLARTVPDSANPIRWVINFPIRSIADAWNNLDGQFALGKHVAPYAANFAVGGKVSGPGGGTDDKVPAMLSDGEFVVRAAVSSRVAPFLTALNSGQPEAMQAAGAGRTPDRMLRLAAGGPVDMQALNRMSAFAKANAGKPYIWGGVGPAGWDCSGWMSSLANVGFGRNPYQRLGVARSVPWPGQARGLGGAFSQGASGVHTAGTIAGINAESGGSPSRVKFGAGAAGADSAQFPVKAFWPQFGGGFVSGGGGGGAAGFDPGPAVDAAFAKAYREIGDMPRFFGPSDQVARDAGVARFAADKVKQKALDALTAMFAASGGGGGDVERWRGVVNQALAALHLPAGWAGDTLRRMQQESGGDPAIVNRTDSNWRAGTPSVGLMQVIGPTYRANRGPVDVGPYLYGTSIDPLSNVMASMNYTMRRYGSLPSGYNRAGGYDNGGILAPGATLAQNNTRFPERVLNNVETRSYDTLTQLLGKNGLKVDVPDRGGSSGPTVAIDTVMTAQGGSPEDLARSITWEVRKARRGGVYS